MNTSSCIMDEEYQAPICLLISSSIYFFLLLFFSELMLLGFMSLLLAATQQYISKICVPYEVADTMLPCRKQVVAAAQTESLSAYNHFANGLTAYGFIWDDVTKFNDDPNLNKLFTRRLADDDGGGRDTNANVTDSCSSKVCACLV